VSCRSCTSSCQMLPAWLPGVCRPAAHQHLRAIRGRYGPYSRSLLQTRDSLVFYAQIGARKPVHDGAHVYTQGPTR
jgi:hypothetical protein